MICFINNLYSFKFYVCKQKRKHLFTQYLCCLYHERKKSVNKVFGTFFTRHQIKENNSSWKAVAIKKRKKKPNLFLNFREILHSLMMERNHPLSYKDLLNIFNLILLLVYSNFGYYKQKLWISNFLHTNLQEMGILFLLPNLSRGLICRKLLVNFEILIFLWRNRKVVNPCFTFLILKQRYQTR